MTSITLEGIQLTITVVGSLVAAVAAVWNLRISIRKSKDLILVRYGRVSASVDEGEYLHTLNKSSHKVQLADYGFVVKYDKKYLFLSVRIEYELGNIDPESVQRKGSEEIQPNEIFEVGHEGDNRTIACYAQTVAMSKPQIGWVHNTQLLDKVCLKTKLWFNRYPHTLN